MSKSKRIPEIPIALTKEGAELLNKITRLESELTRLKYEKSLRTPRRLEVALSDRIVLAADLVPEMRQAYAVALLGALETAASTDAPAKVTIIREDGRRASGSFHVD